MQALVKCSCNLSRTTSIAERTSLGAVDYSGVDSRTLAWKHGSQGIHREEEHFCDFQSFGHGPIVVPEV